MNVQTQLKLYQSKIGKAGKKEAGTAPIHSKDPPPFLPGDTIKDDVIESKRVQFKQDE